MRGTIRALSAARALAALAVVVSVPPAAAGEPLRLRIRAGIGTIPEVADARAAREAVWRRADARARIAIASVCTGCLAPERPVSRPPTDIATQPRPTGAAPDDAPAAPAFFSLAASR